MARNDEESHWTRQLLVGVGALVAVAVVIGGIVSIVALGAARVSGIGEHQRSSASPSLFIPSGEPTTSPEPFPEPDGEGEGETPTSSAAPATRSPSAARVITLQAFPLDVPPNERINLTGVYQGGGKARLQVQRFEGHWVDFPVDTDVTGGLFTTYIYSGREGTNRFRVVDKTSGRASNAVRVTIG